MRGVACLLAGALAASACSPDAADPSGSESAVASSTSAVPATSSFPPSLDGSESPANPASSLPSSANGGPQASPDWSLGTPTATTRIRLSRIVTLTGPVAMALRSGDDAFYVAERRGRVVRVLDGAVTDVVLDLRDDVHDEGLEQGLLGMTFSPSGDRLYVNYIDNEEDTIVASFAMDARRATPASRTVLLHIEQPYYNHNGGDLAFGPDGMLYIATGDGGSAGLREAVGGNARENAQRTDSLLGKILRIDPRGDSYVSPPDNPFAGSEGRDEILHLGLRNPWRFTIDAESGTMWIGDVGQQEWEEINRIPLSARGANFGWPRMEGDHPYENGTPPSDHQPPVHAYGHAGRCAVTGGVVMRDPRLPALDGRYLFSDYCDGEIRFLDDAGDGLRAGTFGVARPGVTAFGTLHDGTVLVLTLPGGIFRIDPA